MNPKLLENVTEGMEDLLTTMGIRYLLIVLAVSNSQQRPNGFISA